MSIPKDVSNLEEIRFYLIDTKKDEIELSFNIDKAGDYKITISKSELSRIMRQMRLMEVYK